MEYWMGRFTWVGFRLKTETEPVFMGFQKLKPNPMGSQRVRFYGFGSVGFSRFLGSWVRFCSALEIRFGSIDKCDAYTLCSISTSTPDYVMSNSFDLNQEPDRHISCFNHGQPIYDSDPLMNEISIEFQPYVSNIVNVKGDGNCGFRAIVVALGYNENHWRQIVKDLSDELLEHPIEYAMLYEEDLNNLRDSLNFYGSSGAPRQYWLTMPPTGFLIANKYGRISRELEIRTHRNVFDTCSGFVSVVE
ncbi:hypothetical protein LXL04_016026 [Taraxacum kok-saghyz]